MAKIMIVEDEKTLNEAYELVLKREGHDVKVALNGNEALDILKNHSPDLVLLDLRMPKMGGIDFLKHLEPEKHSKLKIIIFSNYDDADDVEAAFKHGANRYILKAWSTPTELVKLVEETLGSRR